MYLLLQREEQSSNFIIIGVNSVHAGDKLATIKVCLSLTTIPVEGLRSSSMIKRYLRARKVARVDGISMQGYMVGKKSGCHPFGKILSKSNSFSEFSCKLSYNHTGRQCLTIHTIHLFQNILKLLYKHF